MPKPWNQQQALITGGASGLGLAVAGKLHTLGAEVILFDRDREALDAARQVVGWQLRGCVRRRD